MAQPDSTPKVFICYAQSDNESDDAQDRWLDRVREHLEPLAATEGFEVFCDELLEFGDDWHERIQSQFREARVVILLVSRRFLASKYVVSHELPVLLQRAATEGVRIVPILVSACAFDRIEFKYPDPKTGPDRRKLSSLQSAGSPKETLSELTYPMQERALTRVADAVADFAKAPPKPSSSAAEPKSNATNPKPARRPDPEELAPETGSASEVERAEFVNASPGPASDPWVNSLGMKFLPVPGTEVRFCIWPTRVQDYLKFAESVPGLDTSWKDPVLSGEPVTPGPTHPVVSVSWEDAKRFCEWLTEKDQAQGRIRRTQYYRLPTDLEWSAAVGLVGEVGATPKDRGGEVSDLYPWGWQWPPPHGAGNFADESARLKFSDWKIIEGYRDGYATTSPVGEFTASKDGLYDLSGNVWEWCEDWYDGDKKFRVLRGGSWSVDDPRTLLSSYRYDYGVPGNRSINFGFRVVLVGMGSAR